jgi:uncharacterized membrane protein YkvA (DUF1232 family)
MIRLVLLAAIAATLYWYARSRRISIERVLPSLALALALIYLIVPLDLIPDAGLVGLLDDIAVLIAAAAWARQARSRRQPTTSAEPQEAHDAERDPHEVLGIPRGASAEEITRAYREKMKLYHPDRVNGLGNELQEVATRKTLEIQRAYEALRPPRT